MINNLVLITSLFIILCGCGDTPTDDFKLVGHRGAYDYAPENTIESILLAYEMGADIAECDVLLTKDKQVILLHDDTFLRTGNFNKRADELTYDEIKNLDVGSYKGKKWQGTRVPLLSAVLPKIPRGKILFVEVKGGDENEGVSPELETQLLLLLKEQPRAIRDRIFLISFDHNFIGRAERAIDSINTLLLLSHKHYPGAWPYVHKLEDVDRFTDFAKKNKIEGLSLELGGYLNHEMVDKVKASGLKVGVWNYAEDDNRENAAKMKSFGVNFYNTNDIPWIRLALKSP